MKAAKVSLIVAIFVFVVCASLVADVPHFFNYQGRLMDDAGSPMNATVELDFGIYADEPGTTLLWHEVHPSVSVNDGLFNVYLGTGNILPDSLFDGSVLWLGIKVNDGPLMEPLTPFIASPYSFRAIHADTAVYALNAPAGTSVWSQSGNYVRLPDVNDSVGIGVLNPVEKLHVGGNLLLGAYGDIRFSPDNTRINCESNDLRIRAQSDLYLEPYDDLYIKRRDGSTSMKVEVDNSRVGIRTLSPTHPLTVNGEIALQKTDETKFHMNYYYNGFNISETNVADYRLYIEEGGNVGIGTNSPTEKLFVNGNTYVAGTFHADVFEPDIIDKDNIVDEVGLGYASYYSPGLDLTLDYVSYLSKEITVPTSGYVLAIANANFTLEHGVSGSTGVRMAVSDMPTGLNGSMYQAFLLGYDVPSGDYTTTIPCQRLFNVSAGTHTFYLIAMRIYDNAASINREQMSLLFIPTGYGSKDGVVTAEAPDNFNEADATQMDLKAANSSEADNSAVEPASDSYDRRLEERVESLSAQIEELKRRMEAYEKE
ncbi:MAG TPA: hypothetical protein ENO22_04845 [candidate division Zixibacteria bacterium]|nr:hypothetical protein [candidate division Zixibacteria bacterium]